MPTTSAFYIGGPEVMLRIRGMEITAERGTGRMRTGPWLADPDAGIARGALGVALDDVTGYLVDSGSPDGQWPVSLGIRMDFIADPPLDGSPLDLSGELVARYDGGAMSRGVATDASGATIATMIQRSHLVSAPGTPGDHATPELLSAPESPVREQLGLRTSTPDRLTMDPTPLSANGMGSVHGGILVCSSELAAMTAIEAGGRFRTASVDIVYVRPCIASETTTFTSEIVHRGRSLSVVRVVSSNSPGRASSIATVVLQRI
ncbi:PaaI family thioesterase [Gordonia paraffinivorans]|uniref:PaaI family thioesterase n=1 Tax=Gordonia paraffinivorans TaxID=175628 RepID=UPI003FCD26A7